VNATAPAPFGGHRARHTDTAVPPLDDNLQGCLDDVAHIHPGLDLIRDGIRLIALDGLSADQTQTILAALAGSDGCDALTALALLIQRLTDSDTNPALRAVHPALAKTIQGLGEQQAFMFSEFAPRDLIAEASGLIYEATSD
jgi:hypothetical protein